MTDQQYVLTDPNGARFTVHGDGDHIRFTGAGITPTRCQVKELAAELARRANRQTGDTETEGPA